MITLFSKRRHNLVLFLNLFLNSAKRYKQNSNFFPIIIYIIWIEKFKIWICYWTVINKLYDKKITLSIHHNYISITKYICAQFLFVYAQIERQIFIAWQYKGAQTTKLQINADFQSILSAAATSWLLYYTIVAQCIFICALRYLF